uniref:Uncharacterized protein n=1 Tax=Oryza nivara TaxID=4536 RepID=A0A0E0J2U8_ORYNI
MGEIDAAVTRHRPDRSTGVSDIAVEQFPYRRHDLSKEGTHWKQPSSKPSSSRQATPAACCAALRLLPRGHQPCARAAARRPLPLAACALSALPLALCGCAAAAIARSPQLPRGRNRTPPQRHEKSPQGKAKPALSIPEKLAAKSLAPIHHI